MGCGSDNSRQQLLQRPSSPTVTSLFLFVLFLSFCGHICSLRSSRETSVPADLEKGRGRNPDRRRPTHESNKRNGTRRLAQLVADSLDTEAVDTAVSGGRTVRVYRLYNRCSKKFVRVAGKRVDAAGSLNDIYTHIELETINFDSQVKMRSMHTRDFVCFNRRGRLAVKASGSGRRCVFRELHSVDHYTQFQTVADQRWFVGFNRRGRRLAASSAGGRRRTRCFQFVKTAVTPDVDSQPPTISYDRLYSVLHSSHVISEDPT